MITLNKVSDKVNWYRLGDDGGYFGKNEKMPILDITQLKELKIAIEKILEEK